MPLTFSTNSDERMRITPSGSVGIGTGNVLSWYNSGYTALQIGGMAGIFSNTSNTSITSALTLGYNIYVDSTGNYQYMNTTNARAGSTMAMEGGNIYFSNAAAGTGANPTVTERMRITSTGPVDIGGWGTGTDISLRIKGNSNGQVGFFNHNGQLYMPYLDASTGTDLVLTSGGFINKKSSSIRYKKDIQPIDIGLDFILSLNPVSYNLKDNNAPQVGFIAEDFPEDRLVSLSMIDIQDETKGYKKESVNYAQIVAPLVKAIQELQAQITELKNK